MDRSLWAVLFGTFTLRFSTGLTGAMLAFYLADLTAHHGPLDQILGLGPGQPVGPIAFSVIHAMFYVSELALSPVFGVLSDRLGHHRVMQFGPFFGIVAVLVTWSTTSLPIIGGTRFLEGATTAASVPSILGFIAAATAMDEGLRGRAVARFEAATLAGILGGFIAAGPLFTLLGPTAFLLNGAIYAISLSIYRFGVDPKVDPDPSASIRSTSAPPPIDLRRYWAILTGTHVWLLAPTWIAVNAVLGLYTTQTIFQLIREPDPRFSDQYLMGALVSNYIGVSVGVAAGAVVFFAGLLFWGNRFKDIRRTTIILYGLGGGALLVAGAVAVNHSIGQPDLVRVLFGIPVILGVFVLAGATPAAIGLLADVTEGFPEDRGAIMGLYSVFLGLGQIGGSLIAGVAANAFGLDGVLVASVVLLALAVIPLLSLRRFEHYLAGPGRPAVLE